MFGWCAIRGRGPFASRGSNESAHKRFMVAALVVSAAFLASYVEYHQRVGHVPFWGAGWLKTIYLVVLLPHIVLAVCMVPPIVALVVHALRGRLSAHRRLARWTLPIWLYVSVTGVLVYLMNYAMAPAGAR